MDNYSVQNHRVCLLMLNNLKLRGEVLELNGKSFSENDMFRVCGEWI